MHAGPIDVAGMREAYSSTGLPEADLADDWTTQFGRWLADAVAAALPEPNAMVLGTADAGGRPSVRTVLLKGYDPGGFVFFTNYDSQKGSELAANPRASAVFPWIALARQVVVSGDVIVVSAAESDAYWSTRPRGSQLGALASPQSRPVTRTELDEARSVAESAHPGDVPRPARWGGFRIVPRSVEFWQGRDDRMHDRLRFVQTDGLWTVQRFAP